VNDAGGVIDSGGVIDAGDVFDAGVGCDCEAKRDAGDRGGPKPSRRCARPIDRAAPRDTMPARASSRRAGTGRVPDHPRRAPRHPGPWDRHACPSFDHRPDPPAALLAPHAPTCQRQTRMSVPPSRSRYPRPLELPQPPGPVSWFAPPPRVGLRELQLPGARPMLRWFAGAWFGPRPRVGLRERQLPGAWPMLRSFAGTGRRGVGGRGRASCGSLPPPPSAACRARRRRPRPARPTASPSGRANAPGKSRTACPPVPARPRAVAARAAR